MLILTRRAGTAIQIARDVRVHILEIRGQMARVGIEAPDDVPVWRVEVFDNMAAADKRNPPTYRR